jgi:hypothetical protein
VFLLFILATIFEKTELSFWLIREKYLKKNTNPSSSHIQLESSGFEERIDKTGSRIFNDGVRREK